MSNTAFNSNFVSTGGSSPATQEFRLTLTSNTPVMTTGVTGATTLYLTPYKGNNIGLYASGAWSVVSSAQVNLSLAALSSANTNYDIFAYLSGVTVVLEALAWTNSGAGTSARATALAYQDGVLIKSGDPTRRYIGTIRTVDAGQCQFSFGSAAGGGIEAKLFVHNYYNRLPVSAYVFNNTASWTFSPPTIYAFRAAGGSSTFRVSFVCGVPEDALDAKYLIYASPSVGNAIMGIGLNSTSTPAQVSALTANPSYYATLNCALNRIPTTGFNFVQALDGGWGVGQIANYIADANSGAIPNQTGLQFTFTM